MSEREINSKFLILGALGSTISFEVRFYIRCFAS
jgi:hypothetical protein